MLDALVDDQVAKLLDGFGKALAAGDIEGVLECFQDDCYWRDLVSFTWNIKTAEGKGEIADMLRQQLDAVKPSDWRLADGETATEEDGVTTAWIRFETAVARGEGLIRLKDGKIWTLLTTMAELKGFEEPLGPDRPLGAKHGSGGNRQTWTEEREAEARELGYSRQPEVVIVGGGQGGIALGARLRQLGVPTIILERNDRAGDSWRNRYKSLCLHDPVWYDHLPYLPFPSNWPVFAPKDKLGDWLEMYTRIMELNYWTRSSCLSASYDEAAGEWTIAVDRDGERVTLRPKQLVLAIGMSGRPAVPDFPGMETFRGEQHHSARHPGPDGWAGKKAVVIGSNNSAHDICAALQEHGADVTMVQRSPTTVVRSETLMELDLGPNYSEEALARGITTDKADMLSAAKPYRIMHEGHIRLSDRIRELDKDLYDGLEKAGFRIDWGDDGSGLAMKFLRRFSGYYIDVGASQLIIDGKIKLAHGQVTEIVEDGVVLEDGMKLEADLIVYATGYGSMNGRIADLISQEVADKVGKCWGLGSDTFRDPGPWVGEQRNMWKPTKQEALWIHGGNLHQSRHYSQFLALQLKARMEGIDTPVYGVPEVYHLA